MHDDYYSFLGFSANPFENNTAEREPDIEQYAVRPPYLDRVQQVSKHKGVYVLSGSRGSGKSATRITVARTLWTEKPNPLVVPLINFNVFRNYVKAGIPLDLFANQICFLTIEQVLGWLAAMEPDEMAAALSRLESKDKEAVDAFVAAFYLNRPDTARQVSARESFELLDLSLTRKSKIWLDKRWDQVASVVTGLAVSMAKKWGDFDVGDPQSYEALLKRQQQSGFADPTYSLAKAVEFVRVFGFSGLLVQVDKVDETDWTTTNVDAAARLVYPLLANIQIHEIDGLTWTFYLWDKVRLALTAANQMPVRFDKIPNGTISWDAAYLEQLVAKRIGHFSGKKLNSLTDIAAVGVNVGDAVASMVQLSGNSPRNLVTLLDVILSEHMQRTRGTYSKLDAVSFAAGMDSYAVGSLKNHGLHDQVLDLSKVAALRFVTKDVAGRFRKGSQAARARIDKWEQCGLIELVESVSGPGGGRPVDHFEVVEPCARRIIERSL
jgi:hypothetical protein